MEAATTPPNLNMENSMTEKEMIDTANWLFILSGCAIFATLVAFVITH
jgi:heme/copper-type cytochrome/quinol oxidase subunit 3